MKRIISLCFILAIALMWSSCYGQKTAQTKKTENTSKVKTKKGTTKDPIYVMSVPDMAVEKLITIATADNCVQYVDSLKKIRTFDNTLAEALAKNQSIGYYRITRKVNPCCPCGSSCCVCKLSTTFASPTQMNATMSLISDSGTETPLDKERYEGDKVDTFTVPAGTADGDYKLKVTGKSLPQPLTYDFNVRSGTFDF